MKLYINSKILWGLIISILIILGLGILSYRYFLSLSAASQWSNHARRVVQSADEIRSMLVLIENAQRGYSLTGDEKFVKTVNVTANNLNELISDIVTATKDNKAQQENMTTLQSLIASEIESVQKIIAARKVSFEKAVEEATSAEMSGTMEKINQSLSIIKQEEQSLILSRSLDVQKGFYRFVAAFLSLIFVTLVVLLGLLWLINNNTRLRTVAEQRLRDAELETRKINQDLEAFSYSVSHDLRAPLRSINGYSQILIEDYSDKVDEEGHRILNVIINNAKKMGQLIDDLLEFSRLGRQDIHRATVDVDDQVQIISSELIEREGDRKIELKVQPLGSAMIDSNMMRQVWINLIGNALKYSRNRETTIIEIGRMEQKGEVVFFVKDNGAGFDMAYMDKLFGVFQRLHKNNEFEGTGVGLALVKRIVERHKGRIWAEAKVNEGATFYFSLPNV